MSHDPFFDAEADSNGPAITGVFLRIYKEKQ